MQKFWERSPKVGQGKLSNVIKMGIKQTGVMGLMTAAYLAVTPVIQAQTGGFATGGNTPGGADSTNVRGSGSSSSESPSTVQAREAMKKAQLAYIKGDYRTAKSYADKAKFLVAGVTGIKWEESPDDFLKKVDAKLKSSPGGQPFSEKYSTATNPNSVLPKPAIGQTGSISAQSSYAKKTTTDPKLLLKKGREALAISKLSDAMNYAKQAEANKHLAHWGLFDDTPASLMKDVQKAIERKNRADSDQLLKKARMIVQQLQNDKNPSPQRLEMLEKARAMALQAEQLHGSYSMWDFGDRPISIIRDIETIRARAGTIPQQGTTRLANNSKTKPSGSNRKGNETNEPPILAQNKGTYNLVGTDTKKEKPSGDSNSVANKTQPVKPSSGFPPLDPEPKLTDSNIQQVAGKNVSPVATSKEKTFALNLMREAQALQVSGDFIGAKEKLNQASKYQSLFGPNETSPEMAKVRLNAEAIEYISKLCNQASDQATQGDPASISGAEQKLSRADSLASSMGLDNQAVLHCQSFIKKQKSAMIVGAGTNTGKSSNLVKPVQNLEMPSMPSGIAGTGGTTLDGQNLIDAARQELRRGELDNARNLSEQILAGNYPSQVKTEAGNLLRSVNAESFKQQQRTAQKSFQAGMDHYNAHHYAEALSVFQLIDVSKLASPQQTQLRELLVSSRLGLKNQQLAQNKGDSLQQVSGKENPPIGGVGTASVGSGEVVNRTGPDNPVQQQEAMLEVRYQKLRTEGLKIQTEARAMFGKGETDAAIQSLQAYEDQVKNSNLDKNKIALLIRPIDRNIQQFQIMKKHQDVFFSEQRDKKAFHDDLEHDRLAKIHKDKELTKLSRQFTQLMEAKKFNEAEMVALKMQQIDPKDVSADAAVRIAHMAGRKNLRDQIDKNNEQYNFDRLSKDEDFGPSVNVMDPIKFNPAIFNDPRRKGRDLSRGINIMRHRTDREKEIMKKLEEPIDLKFQGTPLTEVIEYLHTTKNINISVDKEMLRKEGMDPNKVLISERFDNLPVKSVLNIILKKIKLTHIIEDDVLKITTSEGARGKLQLKVLPVTDLVIPIPDAKELSNYDLLGIRDPNLPVNGSNGPLGNYSAPFGLPSGGGEQVSSPSRSGGGKIDNQSSDNGSSSFTIKKSNRGSATLEQDLIKLITSTIAPMTWSDVGGPGTIQYFPTGSALVINQTPDILEQVTTLLEQLRNLQDLEVAIEVRLVALSEAFYERIGVDFNMNITQNTTKYQPNITTGNFSPFPFINSPNAFKGAVFGLTPAGTFTPDLNIPISTSSFGQAIPTFGGFQNSPGQDGGVSFGLAFLNQIQVFLFLEAAQGDRRINIMQAPKLTMFNGQSASLNVTTQQFFLLNLNVISANGQIVFQPQNTPIPLSMFMTLQPVITGDRRFVRLNINQTMRNLVSTNIPLFPTTAFVTPFYYGGYTGTPVPFTQYIQQPSISTLFVQTTVAVPDGGTVLLGGLKTLAENRNEFGPPVLSKIPYLNRLFKNVGYGRESQSMMMMVTPRIIINREEQLIQTGVTETPPEIPN